MLPLSDNEESNMPRLFAWSAGLIWELPKVINGTGTFGNRCSDPINIHFVLLSLSLRKLLCIYVCVAAVHDSIKVIL